MRNPDKEAVRKLRGKQQRDSAKLLVQNHYGNKCACCGEDNPKFLTIDHLDYGTGRNHRKTIKVSTIYIWLVQNNFPEGFRLLCYNCNCGARINEGICPHEN